MAARAIHRSGTGHKYWSEFTPERQDEIEQIAKEINDLFFTPPLKQPIKTLDLPVAGKLVSSLTLPLILNFINISNGLNKKEISTIPDDTTGETTLEYLNACKRIALRINSTDSGSLGLHPAVYLYSKDGNHKIASFYAIVELILDFESNKQLIKDFIKVRKDFEEILLEYDYLVAQIVRHYRGAIGSYPYLKEFYLHIIQGLTDKKTKDQIISELLKLPTFSYLTLQNVEDKGDLELSKDFTDNVKSEAFLTEALSKSMRCKICGGYIHRNAISFDHIIRKADGGQGTLDNAQITHPYCNTTYKN